MYYKDDETATDSTFINTALSAVESTAAESSSFSVDVIPPGKLIRCVVTSVTAEPTMTRYFFFYHEKRAY
jgi:hypothetical protein